MAKRKRYCEPWNAGLASETGAVCRRLARLVQALDCEITSNVARGKIVEDVRRWRVELWKRLERDGWALSYQGGDKLRVYPPGSKTGAAVRARRGLE